MEGVKGVIGLVLSYAINMSHIVVWRGHNFGIVSALLFQNILLISKQVSVWRKHLLPCSCDYWC